MESVITAPKTLARADYGLDAPGVMRNYLLGGIILVAAGTLVPPYEILGLSSPLNVLMYVAGAYCLGYSLCMNLYSRIGKYFHRDRMLNQVSWRGDESVLDIGTGRGLLMIGAAKRLTTGRSYGTDVWIAGDLSSNAMNNTLANAEAEGVANRVEVRTEDARKMTFSDKKFDVIVSLLCLHNIVDANGKFDPEGRREACREIARLLKPGGTAVISDAWHTEQYETELRNAGLNVTRSAPLYFLTFPPLTIVKAVKPVA